MADLFLCFRIAEMEAEDIDDNAGADDLVSDFDTAVVDVEETERKDLPPDPLESLYRFHPECILDYSETIAAKVPLQVALSAESLVDANHRSQPFLSTFERTKILGFRANQLSQGARPYIDVPEYMTKDIDIARMELEQRRLPFIIKRPMPDGSLEYWRLADLMLL